MELLNAITLGNVVAFVILLGSLIGGLAAITKTISKRIDAIFEEKLRPVVKQINRIDEDTTKNFICRCLNDLEQGERLNSTSIERLFEAYDHYTNDLGLNSYIHTKWYDLIEKGGKND